MGGKLSWERIKNSWRFEFFRFLTSINSPASWDQSTVRRFRDKHRREVGFIVASGPSLNKIDLGCLKNYPTIGMNRIYLKRDFVPTYYVLEDHLVAEDNADEISNLRGTEMFIPQGLGYCIKGNHRINYINFVRRYRPFPKFSKDLSERVYWGGTAMFLGLQLAFFLGFKRLYIVGLDHSYAVSGSSHTITSEGADPNHFDPRYFGPGKRFHFPDLARMEKSYELARRVFEEDRREIYNASPGTRLEIFPKISFDEISELKRGRRRE